MDSAPSISSSIVSDFSGIVEFAISGSSFHEFDNTGIFYVKMRKIYVPEIIQLRRFVLVSFIRTIIMYLIVIFVMRIMGKRQIGQLQPYEFVIALMISDLAALPMQDSAIPLWSGIVPILSLLLLQLSISYSVLKLKKVRGFFCGKPCIMIKNGIVIERNLRNQMYTLDDLLEALRLKGYPDVQTVQLAILENNGDLSVLPVSDSQNVTRGDLNIKSSPDIVTDIIIGGCVMEDNLELLNIDKKMLKEALGKNGVRSAKDVFYCYVNGEGQFVVQKKGK
jgi:hypothetical protein